MKVLSKLTIENLKQNKSRTIVTIVGIILSTAMLVCLTGLVSSMLYTMELFSIENSGEYHVAFYDVPADEVSTIALHQQTEEYYLMQSRADLSSDFVASDTLPAQICSFDENALKENENMLTEGRLPENETEVLVSGDYMFKDVAIGDEITLSNDETYTVVGKISEIKMIYTTSSIILYMSEPTDEVTIAVSYKNPADYEEITASIVGADEKYSYTFNTELIAYQTGITPDAIGDTVTIMVIIAAVIIMLTAVFCIRNSFAISINEKIRQYGMLASVGATSKQIKRNVLFESAILGLIAIPIGVVGGISAVYALCKVSSIMMSSAVEGLDALQASIKPLFVLFSVLLACLTIFLSSIGSAIKASKISEIEAIRNTNEIKIKRRTTKVPKIINKLFGIGGVFAYKNLKRNRKKFTTTTIALVVSIVTFISLSYYVGLGFEMVQTEFELLGYNLYVSNTNDAVVDYATGLDGIDEVTVVKEIGGSFEREKEGYTGVQIVCFDDDSYQEFLDINSIEYDENKVVVYDNIRFGMVDGKTIYANLFEEMGLIDSINLFIGDVYVYDSDEGFLGEESGIEKTELEYVRAETLTTGLRSGLIYVIMSGDQFDKYVDDNNQSMVSTDVFLYCQDPYATEYSILDFINEEGYAGSVNNSQSLEDTTESSLMLISIFAFGFIAVIILVGLTNIFNSLSANMKLRKKEFAMLQSIGMTKNEFNKMIRFESICYVAKSLLIGVPLGSIASYVIFYLSTQNTTTYAYNFPIIQVVACSIVVFFVVYAIMKTSLNKISKQNVIETIRQENV